MNRTDRNRLTDLYSLLERVPFPASGSKTTSIAGLSGYAEDMRLFTPAIKAVLIGICMESMHTPELVEDEDYKNPDRLLEAMKEWVDLRSQAIWGHAEGAKRIPTILEIYEKKTQELAQAAETLQVAAELQ